MRTESADLNRRAADLPPLDLLACPLDRKLLIEASAGTGKTWTLCMLVLRLLLEADYELDEILVVTFTEAATAELRGRIRERLREALQLSGAPGEDALLAELVARAGDAARPRLERALARMDRARITTLHGFCQQVLQGWPLLSGSPFSPELLEDQAPLLAELVQDFWRERLYHTDETRQRLLLQSEGLQPGALRQLFAALIGLPRDGLTLLPECPPPAPLPDLWTELQAEFAAIRPLWQAQRAEVEALLSQAIAAKRLKGNAYRLAWLPGLLEQADRAFGVPYLALPLPENLYKLGARRLAEAASQGASAPSHALFARIDALWDRWLQLAEAGRAERLRLSHELADSLRARLEARKRSAGLWAFDDLLLNVLAALRGPLGGYLAAELRRAFPAALIDEFQDTDRIQSEIFNRIYGERAPLFLIGDPKQSIYRFRGADIFAYFATAASPGLQRYSLARNHRSRPALLAGLARLFGQPGIFTAGHASLPNIAYPELAAAREDLPGSGLRLWLEPNQALLAGAAHQRVARAVCAEISNLLAEGVSPGEIAVLTRSHRQARLLSQVLGEQGIPSLVYASEPVFVSREAWELELLLEAVLWPADSGRLKRALGSCLLGRGAAEIAALRADEAAWDAVVERFGAYQRIWRSQGLARLWLRLELDERLPLALAAYGDGERRLANLRQLLELLLAQAERPGMSPAALLDWLKRQRALGGGGESAQQRLESEAEAVRVLTVHRSKGLEFAYVFCPWLWDAGPGDTGLVSCYDPDSERKLIWLESLDAEARRELPLARRQQIEIQAEGIRLAYVALTRARERCYLAWIWQSESRGRQGPCAWSPLASLLGLAGASLSEDELAQRFAALEGEGLSIGPMPDLPAPDAGPAELPGLARPSQEPAPGPAEFSLRDLPYEGRIPAHWRVSSYTSLIASLPEPALVSDRHQPRPLSPEEAEPAGPDAELSSEPIKAALGSDPIQEALNAAILPNPSSPGVATHQAAGARLELSAASGLNADGLFGLEELPGGSRTGTFVHHLLEHVDFSSDAAQLQALIKLKMPHCPSLRGYEASLAALLGRALDAPLHAGLPGLKLSALRRAWRELPFQLPLRTQWPGELQGLLAGFGLAPQGEPGLYLPEGLLGGRLDLVFDWQGRYYVLDYKSSWLGPEPGDYAPARIGALLKDSGQLLQGLIYALALHRHLGLRLPAYRAERDFGGVFYVYLRGLEPRPPGPEPRPPGPERAAAEPGDDPESATPRGVWYLQPGAALLTALSEQIGGPA